MAGRPSFIDQLLEKRDQVDGKACHCLLLYHGYLDSYFYKQLDRLFSRIGDGVRVSRGLLSASNTKTLILAAEVIEYYGGQPDKLYEVTTLRDWTGE
jgi:hypothetical protein